MADDRPTPEERLEQRAEELARLRETEHDSVFGSDQRDMTGELSVVGQHPADVADFTFQRELQLTTETILEREAQQVEDAMRARDEGTYGTCANCGRKISAARLRARPEATLCIDCQREAEGARPG